jgi:hypothetical protein
VFYHHAISSGREIPNEDLNIISGLLSENKKTLMQCALSDNEFRHAGFVHREKGRESPVLLPDPTAIVVSKVDQIPSARPSSLVRICFALARDNRQVNRG